MIDTAILPREPAPAPTALERFALPIGQPAVISYLHHAYPLSIAASDNAFHANLIFNNYVQLRCRPLWVGASAVTEFDFFVSPVHFLSLGGRMPMPQIQAPLLWRQASEIVPSVLSALALGYYVQPPVDEYYVPRRAAYQHYHYVHELLVFGYDRKRQTFDVLGFDERLEFGPQQLSFRQLQDAIALADTSQHSDQNGVRLYRLLAAPYQAAPSSMLEYLEDYLLGRDSSLRYGALETAAAGYVYGSEVHALLASFYGALAERPEAVDIRPLQVVWEHKKCMLTRLDRLCALGLLRAHATRRASYVHVVEQSNQLRLLGLKYWLTRSGKLLGRVAAGLLELARLERAILEPVVDELSGALRGSTTTLRAVKAAV